MVTWLALAVVLQNQEKELGFFELEELKWKATRDVRNGAGEWTILAPSEGEGPVSGKITYRVVDDRVYFAWAVDDQRIEMVVDKQEGLVVNHGDKTFLKLDIKLLESVFGGEVKEPEEEKFEHEEMEEGTMNFGVAQFQSVINLNPVPKWVSTITTELNGRKMTLVTHRMLRDDGSLRGEIKQWFPVGTWLTEKATVRTIDEEGKETRAEIAAKVLDLSGRLRREDIEIPPGSYEGYTDSMEEGAAQALLMMLFAMKGR
jgi:hypothetical protein